VSPDPKIIVAIDFPAEAPALELVDRLDPARCRLKVGKELFTRLGPGFVERLGTRGFEVFLDLKFHDIPNTVAAACEAAADLGAWMINLHASGGLRMMAAARERLSAHPRPPLLIAVTVLTSLDSADLAAIGCPGTPRERVLSLAALARDAGLDGIVCSPREAEAVRASLGPDFRLVTPGVRPAGTAAGDQKRVMTPAQAVAAGADYLVIGRPITAAPDPLHALTEVERELRGGGG
jgi:orotidine-5'-phosphate decarboxylase